MINCGIDVGSNSIRMLIARVEGAKIVEVLHSERHITRLGAGIAATGRLSAEGAEKTLALFRMFYSQIQQYNAEHVFAAATSAVREASDSAQFIAQAREIGIDLRTISGAEEAQYTFMGVKSRLDIDAGPVLIYDIGGGSTEFIYADMSKIRYSVSIPIGVVKLCDKFGFNHITDATVHNECKSYIMGLIQPIYNVITNLGSHPKLIGTAGSVTTLAAINMGMSVYDPEKIRKHILTYDKIGETIDRLAVMPLEKRLEVPGIDKGREDLIIPGALLVQSIIRLFNADSSMVSDCGLREGLTIAAADTV